MAHLSRVLALGFALPVYGAFTTRTTPKLLGVDWGQWAALNASVAGHLQFSQPFGLPCFSSFEGQPALSDPEACAAVQANYTDPVSRSKLFGAYMEVSTVALPHCQCAYPYTYQAQWETCQTTGSGCLLDDSDPTNPAAYQDRDCGMGNIAPVYVHKHWRCL